MSKEVFLHIALWVSYLIMLVYFLRKLRKMDKETLRAMGDINREFTKEMGDLCGKQIIRLSIRITNLEHEINKTKIKRTK